MRSQQVLESVVPFEILNFLGLHKLFMDNLVFKRRTQSSYLHIIQNIR